MQINLVLAINSVSPTHVVSWTVSLFGLYPAVKRSLIVHTVQQIYYYTGPKISLPASRDLKHTSMYLLLKQQTTFNLIVRIKLDTGFETWLPIVCFRKGFEAYRQIITSSNLNMIYVT